jgi:hypothetical protein
MNISTYSLISSNTDCFQALSADLGRNEEIDDLHFHMPDSGIRPGSGEKAPPIYAFNQFQEGDVRDFNPCCLKIWIRSIAR